MSEQQTQSTSNNDIIEGMRCHALQEYLSKVSRDRLLELAPFMATGLAAGLFIVAVIEWGLYAHIKSINRQIAAMASDVKAANIDRDMRIERDRAPIEWLQVDMAVKAGDQWVALNTIDIGFRHTGEIVWRTRKAAIAAKPVQPPPDGKQAGK